MRRFHGARKGLLEQDEIFVVNIDFTAMTAAMVTPNTVMAWGLCPHPYEVLHITIKPTRGHYAHPQVHSWTDNQFKRDPVLGVFVPRI
jgi:hypothetical protein